MRKTKCVKEGVRLYHFTSEKHIEGCERGISKGVIAASFEPIVLIPGMQWLTSNPEKAQSWCEGSTLEYDRTDFRITVDLPRNIRRHHLYRWLDVCTFLVDSRARAQLNIGDPENWYVFHGMVRPEWFAAIDDLRVPVAVEIAS